MVHQSIKIDVNRYENLCLDLTCLVGISTWVCFMLYDCVAL